MMRRLIIALALIGSLFPSLVSADLEGTRRMDRNNRRCAAIGRTVDRDGVVTEREQARVDRWECKRSGDTWVSSRFYQA